MATKNRRWKLPMTALQLLLYPFLLHLLLPRPPPSSRRSTSAPPPSARRKITAASRSAGPGGQQTGSSRRRRSSRGGQRSPRRRRTCRRRPVCSRGRRRRRSWCGPSEEGELARAGKGAKPRPCAGSRRGSTTQGSGSRQFSPLGRISPCVAGEEEEGAGGESGRLPIPASSLPSYPSPTTSPRP